MKRYFKKKSVIFGALLMLLLIWGLIEPYQVDVEEEKVSIDHLPVSWEGKEIIAIGDFQVGMWLDNESNLSDIVDTVIERSPKAVLLLGDYIYHSVDDRQEEMAKVASYLKPLTEEGIPVYAVKGNHDYNMSEKETKPNMEVARRVDRTLNEIGVQVLHNESIPLHSGKAKEPLHLVGIGAHWPNEDKVSKAFAKISESDARFVFMHNPETFGKIPDGKAPAAVAGHTHGGQVRVPFTPHWSWKDLLPSDEAHVDGWVTNKYGGEGNQIYVNRGIGLSILPIRLNNPPEVTAFQLGSPE